MRDSSCRFLNARRSRAARRQEEFQKQKEKRFGLKAKEFNHKSGLKIRFADAKYYTSSKLGSMIIELNSMIDATYPSQASLRNWLFTQKEVVEQLMKEREKAERYGK